MCDTTHSCIPEGAPQIIGNRIRISHRGVAYDEEFINEINGEVVTIIDRWIEMIWDGAEMATLPEYVYLVEYRGHLEGAPTDGTLHRIRVRGRYFAD